MLYHYKTQMINMPSNRVIQCLDDAERALRSTEFKYYAPRLTKVQVDGMSAGWTKEVFAKFTAKAKSLAVEGKVSPELAFKAATDILLNEIPAAAEASSAKKVNPTAMKRAIAADIAVSMALNLPFDLEPTGFKTYQGQKIAIRKMISTSKVVVDCRDVASADVFLFVFVNDEASTARIVGYKKQKDVRTMNRGNKITDSANCRWADMSHWCDISQLNPISDLLREYAITDVPSSVLFEKPPVIDDLPLPENYLHKKMIEPTKDVGDQFYDLLGISGAEEIPKAKTEETAEAGTGDLEF